MVMRKFILLESDIEEIKSMYGLTEAVPAPTTQRTVMDTISAPTNKLVFQNSTNNNNIIFLSVRDNTGKVIPDSKFKYKIGGSYGWFDFNVNIRNLKRLPNGDLSGEAMPTNSAAAYSMQKLVPSNNLTTDKWLRILVPNDKLTKGIQSLKANKGQKATIDAGQGVEITLEYVGK